MVTQGSVAKLMQNAITETFDKIADGTYVPDSFEYIQTLPDHSQHRSIKFIETFKLLPKETTEAWRKALGLIGYRDIGDYAT